MSSAPTVEKELLDNETMYLIVTVVSAIIFILAVGILGMFAFQGANSGWTGYNIVAVSFSSIIALIFLSVALYFGYKKSKEVLLPGVNELKRLYENEKELNKAVKEAGDKVRDEILRARSDAGKKLAAAQTQAAQPQATQAQVVQTQAAKV